METTVLHWRYLPLNKPKNLTHEQIHNGITVACREWNKCLDNLIKLKEGTGELQIHLAFDSKINRLKYPTRIGECRDFSNPKRWEISFDIREKWHMGGWRKFLGIGYDLRATALHEFGHIFDIPHSTDKAHIMHSDYVDRFILTEKESRQYRDFFIKNVI
jgi:hypothetical protein